MTSSKILLQQACHAKYSYCLQLWKLCSVTSVTYKVEKIIMSWRAPCRELGLKVWVIAASVKYRWLDIDQVLFCTYGFLIRISWGFRNISLYNVTMQDSCDTDIQDGEGHWGLRYCGLGQFFLRYFGNFKLEMRYCGILRNCGMVC